MNQSDTVIRTSNDRVQSTDQQALDIEPVLKQAGWTLSLGAIAAVIEALDTIYGPPTHETGEPRHTLDCDMVKHPNCTRCNCGSSVDPDSLEHVRQSPQPSVPAIGAPAGAAAPSSSEKACEHCGERHAAGPCKDAVIP